MEPINRFGMEERTQGFWGYPADGLSDLAERVERVYAEIQPPDDPMLDFDERDLIRLAEGAGFFPIELELQAEIRAMEPRPWEAFLNSSGNPKIPTVAEAMEQALTPEEASAVRRAPPRARRGGSGRVAHGLRLSQRGQACVVSSVVQAVPAVTPACQLAQSRA